MADLIERLEALAENFEQFADDGDGTTGSRLVREAIAALRQQAEPVASYCESCDQPPTPDGWLLVADTLIDICPDCGSPMTALYRRQETT
jgi:hypothetical protein